MYKMCSYHIIDNLIPPSLEVDRDLQDTLLRLESLSACAIVRDTDKCKTLSKIPRPLHTVIWKAYLRERYYVGRDFSSINHPWNLPIFSDLPELLYHWPDEEFILKEIMPNFPSKLSWFSHFWDESTCTCGCNTKKSPPLYQNREYLQSFYSKVVEIIVESFTKSKSKKFCDTHADDCKIRKFDISGFTYIECSVEPFEKIVDSIEVILDGIALDLGEFYVSDSDIEYNSFIDENSSLKCANSFINQSSPIVRYGDLCLYGDHCSEGAIRVIEKYINEGTESVEFGLRSGIDISKLIKDLSETIMDQLNILSFGLKVKVLDSINFLQYFKNLKHLKISEINLHGKLDPLLHMGKGLHFLYLSACSLNNSDLDVLLRSCHKSSLLELNLCHNRFSENNSNLIKLCQELPNLIKLNLDYCRLEDMHDKDLYLLCISINSLPNLAHLSLYGIEFSMDTIASHLISLSASPSLRLLQLMMPIQDLRGNLKKRAAAMKKFCALINTTMNKERSQLLYVEFEEDDYQNIGYEL